MANSIRIRGKVKWYSNVKKYGFITADDGTEAFVHMKEIQEEGYKSLREGQLVEFDLIQAERGPRARRVVKLMENGNK